MKKIIRSWADALCLGGCLLAGPAQAYSAFDPASPYLLGDWGGYRSRLAERGVTFKLDYTGEAAGSLSGGYDDHSTVRYADQTALGAHLDLDQLAGIAAADVQMTLVNRNGHSLSEGISHPDALVSGSSVQEVQGRGSVTRLVQFWYHQRFFKDAVSVKLGRVPVGDDFDAMDSNFQNLAFGGGQAGNWANGVYNWPIAQWAGVAKYHFVPQAYIQLGAFNLNDKNLDNDSGLNFSTSGSNGVLYLAEAGFAPKPGGLPGIYKFGYYHNNLHSIDYGYHEQRRGHQNSGLYYLVRQQVTAQPGDSARGLSLFSMGLRGNGRSAGIDGYLSFGLVYQGLFDGRAKDDLGFALGYLHFNEALKDYADYQNDQLQSAGPLPTNGEVPRLPTQKYEWDAELYYGIAVTDYLTLRPNIQFVANPSGVCSIKDAWVLGTMLQVHF